MTIGQVTQFHHILREKLFTNKSWAEANHSECIKAFDNVLDQTVSHSGITVNLDSPFSSKDCKKCYIVVLAQTEANTPLPRALRTYRVRASTSPRCTIRQALHATLADLNHLPAVSIGEEGFVCASSVFPNVSRLLMKELASAFPELDLACFVNLGADFTRPVNDSRNVGQDLASQFQDLGCFFRLSLKEEIHPESRITSLVMGYLQEDLVSQTLDRIMKALKKRSQIVNILRLGNLAGKDGETEIITAIERLRTKEEIKTAIEKIRAPYDFRLLHERGCLPGTREDVLQPIQSWAEDKDAPNVFWLEGFPGTGKTAITISLKQRLAKAGRLVASCFFRREDASQHSLSTLFRSIASQLVENHDSIGDCIVKTVNSGAIQLENDSSSLFEALVHVPLSTSCRDLKDSIVIVLDGLDEFGRSDQDQLQLIKLLLPKWIQLPRGCKLFISSRSQGDLPQHLDLPAHWVQHLAVGDAASPETINDIRKFFEYSLEDIQSSFSSPTPLVNDAELTTLVKASSGLFIWASTVIKMVKQKPLHKAARRFLRDLCGQNAASKTTQLQPLYELYRTVLDPLLGSKESNIEQEQLSDDALATQTFFSALVSVRIPLSPHALALLCEADVHDINDIVRALTPVMDTTLGLRFAHKSFLDYVQSEDFPIRLDLDEIELAFTRSCFNVMRSQLRFNMGNMPSSYMLNSEMPGLYKALSEELRYASCFWGAHLMRLWKVQKEKPILLVQLIDDFFSRRFLYWLEAVSILGCLREAIEGLSTLRGAGFGKVVSDCAQDALAFLRQFALPISQSYPHIYLSAVPWAPAPSLIRTRYCGTVKHVLNIASNGDETWPAQLAVIHGHNGSILSVAFSPDSTQIVSASEDCTIRIWDTSTRQPVGEPLRGHGRPVSSVTFSPNGSQIISGSYDGTIRIWDATTRQPVGVPLLGHTDAVYSVAISPDGALVVSASGDKTIRIWDTITHQPVGVPLGGHRSMVYSAVFSLNGSQIVSGSHGSTIYIWDVASQQLLFCRTFTFFGGFAFSPDGSQAILQLENSIRIWDLARHQGVGSALQLFRPHILSAAFSPDGSHIIIADDYNNLCIWDTVIHKRIGERLAGHSGQVRHVAFSPDGSQIVSGSNDKTIRIWDAATIQPFRNSHRCHTGAVNSVAISPDGSHIISGSFGETVRIWDASTRQPVGEPLHGTDGWVESVAFSPDGSQIVIAYRESCIRVCDLTTHQLVDLPLHRHESIYSVAFSPDGSQIVGGCRGDAGGTVRIWDVTTFQPVGQSLPGHRGAIHSVAFSPDGSQIISASDDKTIRIWDVSFCRHLEKPFGGHNGPVHSVAFSPDDSQIVSGSADGTVQIWDAATRQPVGVPLRGHEKQINWVGFSPNGSQVVSGSEDYTIRIWEVATCQPAGEPLRGHTGSVLFVVFSPDGSQIASGSEDSTIRVWDVATHQPTGKYLQGHSGSILSVAYSPDGSKVVSGSSDETIRIWDASTWQPIGEPLRGPEGAICSAVFSQDGSQIIGISGRSDIQIWDVMTHQPIEKKSLCEKFYSVAWSPDGSQIITGNHDTTIRIWDAATLEPVGERLGGHYQLIRSLAFSSDGSQIVSGSFDTTIRTWETCSAIHAVKKVIRGHEGTVYCAEFSPDGAQIISASEDSTIRIWDAATHQSIGDPLRGHKGAVRSVAFSPDGSQIVSGSSDNTIRIWDAVTHQAIGEPLQGHTKAVNSVVFSPSGSQIISGSNDCTIRIWDATVRNSVKDPTWARKTLLLPRGLNQLPLHCYLCEDGWVTDEHNCRLVWVPQHLHEFLPARGLIDIIGPRGMIAVDASDMVLGKEWSVCVSAS